MSRQDLTISVTKASILSIFISIPVSALLVWLFILRWGSVPFRAGFNSLFGNFFYYIAVIMAGIVIHELIHGITWVISARKPLSSIKFGLQLKTLTPYAHCKEPMPVNAYRIGAVMPLIVLGIIPSIIAIINGSGQFLVFGILFILAAGGDMVILLLLRKVTPDKLVQDHPTEAGCYVLDKDEEA